jgi:hypothetical protein
MHTSAYDAHVDLIGCRNVARVGHHIMLKHFEKGVVMNAEHPVPSV